MKKGLFNFINDIPLNSKFLMIYVFCVLVPILTINLVFWNKISNDIKQRETENYNISINRVKTDISNMLEGCVDVSHSVSSDKVLYQKLERHFNSDDQYYQAYDDLLRDRINRYLPIYNDVSQIGLYTSNNTIDSGGNYYFIDRTIKNASWYKEVFRTDNQVNLYTYRKRSNDGSGSYTRYLSILRQLNEFASSRDRYTQILKIDVDMNKLYDIFDRERDYLNLFLIDPNDDVVCSTDNRYNSNLPKSDVNFNSILKNNENSTYFKRKLGTAEYLNGWHIIGIANRKRITNEVLKSNILTVCIIVTVTLLSSFLILIIVRSYNYRLRKLSKHMLGVKNQNFELIEIAEGKDEIGKLIFSFNMMTAKINTLINDVYKLQIKKKDLEIQRVQAELKFLQSQVDPHFLFNTLNAVMAICVKNNYTDLTDVIKYLSKIFRRLISWKDDLVSVQEEISFTEMYLKIEKFRFLEKFDYQIEVDDKAIDMKVPKMSIQTIVENACKHGIQSTAGIGVVKIKVGQKENLLSVEVEDNGLGIDKDKLREILESLSEEDDFCENIGIRNVYKRLHLYYGDEVKFSIDSEPDKGTIVHYEININSLTVNKHAEIETI